MGEKDATERTLMAFNDVFADIMNVYLFGGDRIIKPEDLLDIPARETYVSEGTVHGLERDIAKRWSMGSLRIACLGLENQTAIDDDMALRIMGYEGAEYRTQLFKENKSKPLYPVVSIVLYLGYDRRWSGPKTLAEAVGVCNGNPLARRLAPFVTNLEPHVFEVAWQEDKVDLFQSGFRVVADYLVKRRKHGDDYVPSPQELDHVEAVVELLRAMTGDNRYKEALEMARAQGGRGTEHGYID